MEYYETLDVHSTIYNHPCDTKLYAGNNYVKIILQNNFVTHKTLNEKLFTNFFFSLLLLLLLFCLEFI